jgi:hypothetical protein
MVKAKIGGRKTKPIQDLIDIKHIVSFRNTGSGDVGAILMEKDGVMVMRVAHETAGAHNDITFDEAVQVASQFRDLCSEMPFGESVIIDRSNFPSYKERYAELEEMIKLDSSNPLNMLAFIEQQSLKEKSSTNDKGRRLRNKSQITFWSSISSSVDHEELDIVGKMLWPIDNFLKSKSGEAIEQKEGKLKKYLLESWNQYIYWDRLYTQKLSCLKKLRFLNAEEIWEKLWAEHNRFSGWEAGTIPDLIEIDVLSGTITRKVDELSQLSLRSALCVPPASIPVTEHQSILVDNKYVVATSFVKQPKGWENELYQINWLADLLANTTDTRCVIEFKQGNPDLILQKMRGFAKDAIRGQVSQAQKGESDEADRYARELAAEGERAIITGNVPVEFGLSLFVYRDSEKDAIAAARDIADKYRGTFQVEKVTTEQTWFQSLPHVIEPLLGGKIDRRLQTDSISFPAYLPLGTAVSIAETGIEMRSKHGFEPIFLDFLKFPGHWLTFGESREAGKSVFMAYVLAWAMLMGRFATIIDIPQNEEAASFKDYTEKAVDGKYFDIVSGEHFYNFLETTTIPPGTQKGLRQEMIKDCSDNIRRILMVAVLGADLYNSKYSTSAIDVMLTNLLGAFFAAEEIRNQYRDAKDPETGGLGSEAWQNMPTVVTFVKFIELARIPQEARSKDDEYNLGFIKSQLTAWFAAPGCKAPSLAKPSTFSPTARLLTIGLRKFSNNDEAALYGLVAQGLAYSRAVQFRERGTIIFNDENAIAFQYKSLADGLGALYANGLKANCIVGCAMQPPDTISQSSAAGMINANKRYVFLGKIASGTEAMYSEHLGIPIELVAICADSNFAVNKAGGYSSYLFKQDSTVTFVEVEPQRLLLNVMKNNEHQRRERAEKLKDCQTRVEILKALQEA